MKDDTRVEGPFTFGIPPARRNVKGDLAQRNKELLEKGADKAVEDGDISIRDYVKYKNAIDEFRNCNIRPEPLPDLDNYWVYGPPGSGKTTWALKNYPDYYEKDKSKYWNGYTD